MRNLAPDLARVIEQIMRDDRGRLLAALIRSLGDLDLAEEALSDATKRAGASGPKRLAVAPRRLAVAGRPASRD